MTSMDNNRRTSRTERAIIDKIYADTHLNRETIRKVVRMFSDEAKSLLLQGEPVCIGGFVTLSIAENKYRNIGAREGIQPNAQLHPYRPKARFAQAFKEDVGRMVRLQ